MKLDLGETYGEYLNRIKNWHKWFAWYPVRVASHDYRWLEYVERRGEEPSHYMDDIFWVYRAI